MKYSWSCWLRFRNFALSNRVTAPRWPVQMTDKGQKGQWTKAALEVKASDKKDYWLLEVENLNVGR